MADFVSGYNVIQKLGDGARSQVYQVVRPATGEVFALKRVTRENHEDTRFLDQAIREHEISAALSHSYLRQSYELKRIRKLLKLVEVQVVMEFVDGVSLDKCRPDRMDKAVDLFLKVAEGLHCMHEHGFLHTDIKPNNILLTYDGAVKIIDFGQSCEIGFRKPRIQGTPDYIAPEQVDRRNLTQQTDVFNLGATLYWALTGQTYPTLITKGQRRQEAPRQSTIPTPQDLIPDIPAVLSRLVMQCCAHDRVQRPKDMKELISRLETAHHVLRKRRGTGPEEKAERPRQPQKPTPHKPASPPHSPDADDSDSDDSYDYSAFADLAPNPDSDSGSSSGGDA